jgi:hypothetical protein
MATLCGACWRHASWTFCVRSSVPVCPIRCENHGSSAVRDHSVQCRQRLSRIVEVLDHLDSDDGSEAAGRMRQTAQVERDSLDVGLIGTSLAGRGNLVLADIDAEDAAARPTAAPIAGNTAPPPHPTSRMRLPGRGSSISRTASLRR